MIPDKLFKQLTHSSKGYRMLYNGNVLEKGYKPDYVLQKQNDYIILESENGPSRKTFVGGLIKAAHYLQGERTGKLIFIMIPKKNTTVSSIANHLIPYLKWIQNKTNLREVFVVEANSYYNDGILIKLDGKDFKKCAIKVEI